VLLTIPRLIGRIRAADDSTSNRPGTVMPSEDPDELSQRWASRSGGPVVIAAG
jgi:hypothetical protein